jgi:hypothetical protein
MSIRVLVLAGVVGLLLPLHALANSRRSAPSDNGNTSS